VYKDHVGSEEVGTYYVTLYKNTIVTSIVKTGRRKLSPKGFSTIESYSRPIPDSPPFGFWKTAQVYTQSMTKLPTLKERHKIPILSSTCSTCPQPSYVWHCCAALTYKLWTLTFLVLFPNQIFRGSFCPTCEKFGLGVKLKKFQACSGHVTVAYVPTSSDVGCLIAVACDAVRKKAFQQYVCESMIE